jgi:activator of HSP90 ATPase
MSLPLTRRAFAARLVALLPAARLARPAFGAMPAAQPRSGISRTAEAIHQEVDFRAGPALLYRALLDGKQFSALTGGLTAEIAPEPGGAFALFGGQITGRVVELVSGERIVQAWRAESWDAGAWSIARFELGPRGSGTRLVLDHTGFPRGQAEHLLAGWRSHYWTALAKVR